MTVGSKDPKIYVVTPGVVHKSRIQDGVRTINLPATNLIRALSIE